MESTSPEELAAALLEECLRGRPCPLDLLELLIGKAADPDPGVAAPASQALFKGLVEPLADRFDPGLVAAYVGIFSRVMERFRPELKAAETVARYERIGRPRHFADSEGQPKNVFVLSRVTLGADVAITSVVLDAAKKRFPGADIWFVGGRKGWELFAADTRVQHLEVSYGRAATLAERLEVGRQLEEKLGNAGGIVIDPDSRLTQLGLMPVCAEQDYFFFESRAYGGDSEDSLPQLTKRWVGETFGVVDAMPYIAPEAPAPAHPPVISISLGVGENPAKRVPDPFEEELLRVLAQKGVQMLIDTGAGGEEAERVERAVAGCGARLGQVRTWRGAFAPFAAAIAASRLYVGYDSAGQHVAATCGVPLVTVFAGFQSPCAFARWHPTGPGPIEVVRVETPDAAKVLAEAVDAADRLLS